MYIPNPGPVNSGCFWVSLPKAYKQRVTCGTLRRSNKSAVWKISSSGTPYFLRKAWNLFLLTETKSFNCNLRHNLSIFIHYWPLNIFHQLEIGAAFLNFLDRSRCHFICKLTKNNAILQDILIVALWNCLA